MIKTIIRNMTESKKDFNLTCIDKQTISLLRIEAKATHGGYRYALIDGSYNRQEIPEICFDDIDETDGSITVNNKELMIVGTSNEQASNA